MAQAPRTAVLFLTHRFDRFCLDAFDKLRREGPTTWDYRVLSEAELPNSVGVQGARVAGDLPQHRFRFSDMVEQGYQPIEPTLVPGSTHFGLFHFALAHPEYQHLWQVEYDVRYTGNWSDFFAAQSNDADLLTSHIRTEKDEPDWHWWGTLGHRAGAAVPPRLRAFHPIFRLSRRAIRYLDSCYRSGWYGHYETTVPTLLHDVLMSVEEFGGKGPFVRRGNERRFYPPSESRPDGFLTGTMRWRPDWTTPLTKPNTLYHPVKEPPWGAG